MPNEIIQYNDTQTHLQIDFPDLSELVFVCLDLIYGKDKEKT